MVDKRKFKCFDCGFTWELPFGVEKSTECPSCMSNKIHRIDAEAGMGNQAKGRGRRCGVKLEEKLNKKEP